MQAPPVPGMLAPPRLGQHPQLSFLSGRKKAVERDQLLPSEEAAVKRMVQSGRLEEAVKLYERLRQEGVHPSRRTLLAMLTACGRLADLDQGKRVHADLALRGREKDLFVATALVDMYAKCGSMADAQLAFDRLPQRDVVAWNALLAGYAGHGGDAGLALTLFARMEAEGVAPDDRSFVSALKAVGSLADQESPAPVGGRSVKVHSLALAKEMHARAARRGLASDAFVASTLVSVYAKCGSLADAELVFGSLERNVVVVAWNALLAGYANQEEGGKAVELYDRMVKEGLRPDDRTFVSVVQACGILADREGDETVKVEALRKGKAVHAEAAAMGHGKDVFVGSTLVSMYCKCGSTGDAQRVLDELSARNVVSWNAMLAGHTQQGQSDRALWLYGRMRKEDAGVLPDETTFVCVLKACSDVGDLDTCARTEREIVECRCDTHPAVANTLIHAYGKCGSMGDARRVLDALARPDVVAWNALMAGYALQGDWESSLRSFEEMERAGVEADGVTLVALLCACSHAGFVDKGLDYFTVMTRGTGIVATVHHYSCLVDLLGRAGLLSEAEEVAGRMPVQPDAAVWLSLLGACRKHGNVEIGRRAFAQCVKLRAEQSAAYMLMSDIYAQEGMWDCANQIDELRWKAGAWKQPGQSWIRHDQQLHMFLVQDHKHEQRERVYETLAVLNSQLAWRHNR